MEVIHLILLAGSILKLSDAGVTMEVKFIRYVNPGGKGDNGECCDGKWGFCGSPCDHQFTICMDKSTGKNNVRDCPYGKYASSEISNADTITFGSNFGGVKNPMYFKLKSWPGSVKLKVDIYDIDHNNPDRVEFLSKELSPTVASTEKSAKSAPYRLKIRTWLDITVKAFCDKDYYGPACDKYCKAHDDNTGHYSCDEKTGERVCLPGWQGSFCDNNGVNECLETQPCDKSHVCLDRPVGYDCACPLGYSGENCTSIAFTCDDKPCKNGGNCSIHDGQLNCTCMNNWTGLLCENSVDACAENPCENNGTCELEHFGFSCICPEGYSGSVCNITLVTSTPPIDDTTVISTTTTTAATESTSAFITENTTISVTENTTIAVAENTTFTVVENTTITVTENTTSDINGTESFTTTTPQTTTKEIKIAYITLVGRLLGDDNDQVRKGIENLLTKVLNLQGNVQVITHNAPVKLKNGEIVTKVLIQVKENDKDIDAAIIDKVFSDTDPSVIEQYIPLPMYYEGSPPRTQPLKEEHNSWIHHNWYIVLVIFVAVIALSIFLTGFIVYKRKKSVRMGQKDVVARQNSNVSDAFPAQSFENSLYFEMNNQHPKRDNTRVRVNVNPTS